MNIYDATPSFFREIFELHGENPAKADIIIDGLYRRGVTDFSDFGFSERFTEYLRQRYTFELPEIVEVHDSTDAAKLLLKLCDGEFTETVLMRQSYGNCVCVSTQVGCSMRCRFCRSGRISFKRNLRVSEMVGQVLAVQKHFGIKVTGVSVMGIGEPFLNYMNVVDFCEIVTAPKGLAIGSTHVTVSTCGLVHGILAIDEASCNLAISLHAPNNELRSFLMPINREFAVEDVIKAARAYSGKTNRRVALEYIMLDGVNDTPELAEQLAELIGDSNFFVNIIPYNQVEGDEFRPSSRERIMAFYDVLKKHKIGVTMRREFGSELKAACGQLSAEHE